MFFDEDIIEHIVTETNRYASQKNKPDNISSQELKCFLGVLIISGYIQLPRRRMFWEREKDTHNDLVASAISRDRFEFLMIHLHLTDNTIDKNDRFAKMRPLFTHLNKIFLKFATLQESHSVDEAMVPYYGRHGCKQYIHGKPIRYGFKLWMGCTRLEYVNWFEPYQGATTHTGTEYRHLGVGAGVVLTYADTLKSKWPDAEFHLYFDNFFNSIPLLTTLSKKNLRGTGTIRTNRIPNNPFSLTSMKKKLVATMSPECANH
ncbi:Transposase IS4 [Popillia japonica]|uniref:Transposase IS4 n=1 Tax=Popillia japonica TaxID=7064 RepID=A0AAW1KXN3_POPJA